MPAPIEKPKPDEKRWFLWLLKHASLVTIVFLLTITLSFIAWFNTEQRIEKDARSYFENEVLDAKAEFQRRIQHYIDTLYSVQGLFNAYGNIQAVEWQKYLEALKIEERLPGVEDIYFARYIPKEKKGDFERKLKKELHDPSRSIYPPGDRENYFPVEFTGLSKIPSWNKAGFDIGHDLVRREAVERAIETGKAAATGKISLFPNNKTGFALRVPIFRSGMADRTPEEKRRALIGFVSASMTMETMAGSLFSKEAQRDFNFEIYDNGPAGKESPGNSIVPEKLGDQMLYIDDHIRHFNKPGGRSRYDLTTRLNVAGEEWIFYFYTRPNFHFGMEHRVPFFVLFSGIIISFLLSGITWSLSTARSRAERLANEMTLDLRESEEKFRMLAETATDAIITVNHYGEIVYVNKRAYHIFGYSLKELIGKPYFLLIPEKFRESQPGSFLKQISTKLSSRGGKSVELIGLRKDQREIPVELSMTRWKSNNGLYFTAIIRDISDRKKTEESLNQKNAFVQLLYVVTVAANESSSLEEALQTCLNEICGHMGWPVGHVYFKSAKGEKPLCPSTIWYFDQPSLYIRFKIETEKSYFGPGEGLPGMVLESGEPISLQLTSGMQNFTRIRVVEKTGIKFGFAIPLMVKDDVVAVLEFFSREIMEPDASTLEVMAHIGTQLGRVVERKRAQEELDFLATHDPLSHLPNRTLFSDRLKQAIANAGRNNCFAAVLFVDLDQFKRINDTPWAYHRRTWRFRRFPNVSRPA
jgi:PAS domain S-box-containing protein